ncbi:MAG: AsmA family protein [Candidatus Acidiferrales bacterium]
MKRWAKIVLAIVGFVILVGAAIPLFVKADTFRPVIERQLSATVGREVKFGELRLSVFTGSLIAQDLSVADDPAFSSAPFVTAKELRIGVSLKPLIFAHEVNLRGFQIASPQINLIRAANGTWNFSSMGHGAASSGPSNGPAPAATPGRATSAAQRLADLSIGLIVVEDGRVTITSQRALNQPTVYEHVNLTAHDFSFAARFPFELGASLPADGTIGVTGHLGPINRNDAATSPAEAQISLKGLDPVASGFLDASAGVALLADVDAHAVSDGQTLTASGTAHIENLKLRNGATAAPKSLDISYSVVHRTKETSGQINDVAVQIGDAAAHLSGTYQPVTPGAMDPLLDLKLSGQSLPIDELQPLMTAAAVRLPNGSVLKGGTLSLDLAIKGPVKALVITGPIALDNTRLVGFDIGTKIHGIAALSGVKTGDSMKFQKLRVYVRVTNAGVVADRIEAVIPAMGELTGNGTVSADNQLDFNLIVKVASANGVGKLGVGLLSKLRGSGDSGKGSGVPMRVTGTPDEPYITADVGGIVTNRAKSIASIFGKKK